jgi:hypothetical protein
VAFIALGIGAIAGEHPVIAFGALAGGLWAVLRARSMGNLAGLSLMLRMMLTALALTGALALWLQHQYQWPAQHLLAPLAFFIAGIGDRWAALLDLGWRRAYQWLGGDAQPPGGPQ